MQAACGDDSGHDVGAGGVGSVQRSAADDFRALFGTGGLPTKVLRITPQGLPRDRSVLRVSVRRRWSDFVWRVLWWRTDRNRAAAQLAGSASRAGRRCFDAYSYFYFRNLELARH